MNEGETKLAHVLDLFSRKPWVGLIGTIGMLASTLGLIITLVKTSADRRLTYAVNPVRTTIAAPKRTTGLKVIYNDTVIVQEVTACQVAIWNSGKKPIWNREVLDSLHQVRIVVDPSVRILQALPQVKSRPQIGFEVDDSHRSEGYVACSWGILERYDGDSVELIYEGPRETSVEVIGTIVGQGSPYKMEMSREIKLLSRVLLTYERSIYVILGAAVIIVLVADVILYLVRKRHWEASRKEVGNLENGVISRVFMQAQPRLPRICLRSLVSLLVAALVLAVIRLVTSQPAPPFGF